MTTHSQTGCTRMVAVAGPLALAVALAGSGCHCGDSVSQGRDAGPGQDARADAGLDSDGPRADIALPDGRWFHDLGPDPDINFAACVDARAVPDITLKQSLDAKVKVLWKAVLGKGRLVPTSPVVGPDGTAYLTTSVGYHAVSAQGKVIWTYSAPPGTKYAFSRPLVLLGSYVLAVGNDGAYAVALDGKKDWVAWMAGPYDPKVGTLKATPALLAPKKAVFAASNRRFYVVSAEGKQRVDTPMPFWAGGATVDRAGNSYLAVATSGARIVSVDTSGKVRWLRSVKPASLGGGPVAITPDGAVLVVATNDENPGGKQVLSEVIAALDPACGRERRRFKIKHTATSCVLVDPHGNILFAQGDAPADRIVKLSPAGKQLWAETVNPGQEVQYTVSAGFGPLGADGTLYVFYHQGWGRSAGPSHLRAYSAAGKLLWKLPIADVVVPKGPALRDDGVLLLPAQSASPKANPPVTMLIAVQTRSPGMMRAGWPRPGHDNLNSGNAGF